MINESGEEVARDGAKGRRTEEARDRVRGGIGEMFWNKAEYLPKSVIRGYNKPGTIGKMQKNGRHANLVCSLLSQKERSLTCSDIWFNNICENRRSDIGIM